jgi:hypothetical protein
MPALATTGRRCGVCAGAAAVAALLVAAPAASAAPIPCTTTALVDAIDAANVAPDATTIELAAGCTYTLTTAVGGAGGPTGLPTISSPVIVQGNGATLRRDPAAPEFRLLRVGAGSLRLEDATLTGGTVAGSNGNGGAIHANCDAVALELRRVVLSGNAAGLGGALSSCAPLSVEESLLVGNTADLGGALVVEPGVAGDSEVVNSTFSDNRTLVNTGSAVFVFPGVRTLLRHTTIAGNQSAVAGGAVIGAILRNTILADNVPDNCGTPIDAQGRNLAFPPEDASCQGAEIGGPEPHEYVTGDPLLRPLGDRGGPTESMLPQTGSASIDAGTGAYCATTDQRGEPRPAGLGCDLGAVEVQPLPPVCADVESAGAFGAAQRIAFACSDPNGYPLTYSVVVGPSNGTVGPPSAIVDYTPRAGFAGADAFTYRASNGSATATAVVRVTVGAGPPPEPPPPTGDVDPPDVNGLSISPRRLRVGRSATVAFTLSEPAAVELAIERRRPGIRVKRGARTVCVRASRVNKRKARREAVRRLGRGAGPRAVRRALRRAACKRWARSGILTHDGSAGRNSVPLSGRIRGAALPTGTYRLTVTAVDAAGNRAVPRRVTFTIVRGR